MGREGIRRLAVWISSSDDGAQEVHMLLLWIQYSKYNSIYSEIAM